MEFIDGNALCRAQSEHDTLVVEVGVGQLLTGSRVVSAFLRADIFF